MIFDPGLNVPGSFKANMLNTVKSHVLVWDWSIMRSIIDRPAYRTSVYGSYLMIGDNVVNFDRQCLKQHFSVGITLHVINRLV